MTTQDPTKGMAEALPHRLAFQAIAYVPLPFSETSAGQVELVYRRHLLGEFLRKLYSRFPYWVPDKAMLKQITPEVDVWCRTWDLLERQRSMGRLGNKSMAEVFALLTHEPDGLLCLRYDFSGETSGATALLKKRQSQNRALEGLENPFQPNTLSWVIIGQAIELASSHYGRGYSQFYKDRYMPLIRARMGWVTAMKNPDTDLVEVNLDGSLNLRGKRDLGVKKKPQKNRRKKS